MNANAVVKVITAHVWFQQSLQLLTRKRQILASYATDLSMFFDSVYCISYVLNVSSAIGYVLGVLSAFDPFSMTEILYDIGAAIFAIVIALAPIVPCVMAHEEVHCYSKVFSTLTSLLSRVCS